MFSLQQFGEGTGALEGFLPLFVLGLVHEVFYACLQALTLVEAIVGQTGDRLVGLEVAVFVKVHERVADVVLLESVHSGRVEALVVKCVREFGLLALEQVGLPVFLFDCELEVAFLGLLLFDYGGPVHHEGCAYFGLVPIFLLIFGQFCFGFLEQTHLVDHVYVSLHLGGFECGDCQGGVRLAHDFDLLQEVDFVYIEFSVFHPKGWILRVHVAARGFRLFGPVST